MNPYAEIEVTPLYSSDGMQSQGKSVRIRDEDTETGWDEIGVVSPNYLLVHNTRVKDVLDQIAERSKIADWKQRKLFFDGRRFVYCLATDNISAEVSPGDLIRFGLIAYNSYDGSRALSVGAYAEHLVCSNGMTSDTYFARFLFRHNQGNMDWDDQTMRAFMTVMSGSRAKLIKLANTLQKLQRKPLAIPDMRDLRREYLSELSVSAWGRIVDGFLADGKHSAFGLLDACTRVFWHNEKQSFSDYRNNTYSTDGMIQYAEKLRF
jgi:hypothetical protein